MSVIHPPRHIVWSASHLDLSDPYQRRWYLRQVLAHGRAWHPHPAGAPFIKYAFFEREG